MGDDVMKILKDNNLTADDVDWVVPHEANLRIIEAVTKRAELPMDKVVINIDHYGNTSAATIPLALWDNEANMKRGDNVIFTAFGAGFVHGASFYKWAYDGSAVEGVK
jgi:3-oxoacyl-[acyl-carrier-protein] synthase-3